MRNKLYYLLFLVYIGVAVFVMLGNGIFTGNVESMSNLVINIGFLILIGILLIISMVSFSKLNRCTARLVKVTDSIYRSYDEGNHNLWDYYGKREKVFGHKKLDEAFYRYQKRMMMIYAKQGGVGDCDVEDYINEELLNRVGMSYYNSAISGTMTGLGILGTFIGLSLGLGGFSGNDIYTISDNIGPLLSGMKVAFHTSVYGIIFSLIFHFVYRCIMSDAYDKLHEFLACFRECVEPVSGSLEGDSKAMLIYQANTANYLKELTELVKGQAFMQQQAVERMVAQFTKELTGTLGTDLGRVGKALENVKASQQNMTDQYKHTAEVTEKLLQACAYLQKEMDATISRQGSFEKEIKAQSDYIKDSCEAISEEVSNQLYTYGQFKDM